MHHRGRLIRLASVLPAATAILAAAALGLVSCAPGGPRRQVQSIFQSTCVATLHDHGSDETFSALWTRLRELDGMLSMWKADSALSRLSAAAGTGPVQAPGEIVEILERGLMLARETDGRYDPTVGPLVKLWGIGTDSPRVPSPDELRQALDLTDWRRVRIDREAGTVALEKPGMVLDFGSQAKGYAAVAAGELLADRGVRSALVDLGGCVLALGSRSDGKPWRIGVQDPEGKRGAATVGYFLARDAAVSTSGTYERRFEAEGRIYHHIMDTRTGYPADTGIVAVTVMTPRGENPDGPTLAIFVSGPEAGLALANRMGIAAAILLRDRRILLSERARDSFVLTDTDDSK